MSTSQQLVYALKAARELGLGQVGLFAQYQVALRSGWLRRITPAHKPKEHLQVPGYEISLGLISVPDRARLTKIIADQASALLAEANDLKQGRVRLFGGPPQDLNLVVPLPLLHWTKISLEQSKSGKQDIKLIWGPARFTWVYPLARAFILSGDESYVETFWHEFEAFADINLPNLGPNWVSAQEVALRLISLTFAIQVFSSAKSSSPERINRISLVIADHAKRIPATLCYARAQNNNHLLSEAAGLITAAAALPAHPEAKNWQKAGQHWFNHALENQISDSGTYIQHSTNYHRVMLQLALWVSTLESSTTEQNKHKLASATHWLLGLADADTGRVPNLGHNDGSYVQNLASSSYSDYRPVLQAAAIAFLGEPVYDSGPWDELALWLGLTEGNHTEPKDAISPEPVRLEIFPGSHLILNDQTNSSWASFRVAKFSGRPAHADQLHLDLWWQGHNIALDPGTYFYNAPAPWQNPFTHSSLHNTVTIDGQDQMTYAGRFLWLDWAQAEVLDQLTGEKGKLVKIVAQHDGYTHLGVIHRRSVTCESSRKWIVEDELFATRKFPGKIGKKTPSLEAAHQSGHTYRARLHWMLPDWSWKVENVGTDQPINVQLRSPAGWINLNIGIEPAPEQGQELPPVTIQLVRAGELVYGTGSTSAVSGWVSPTYAYKIPALSLAVQAQTQLPVKFWTEWILPQVAG
ncbi:MAG: alginate lyase family protein [Anaerolineales bacterium]